MLIACNYEFQEMDIHTVAFVNNFSLYILTSAPISLGTEDEPER